MEKSHSRIAIPEAKAMNLMLALHVRHANFQHGWISVGQRYR